MTEILISLQEAIEAIESVPEGNWKPSRYVKELEKLDPVEIVLCKDCRYYDPPHVENNGVRYEYDDMPVEAFDKFGTGFVHMEYGVNVGGRCCRDYEVGYAEDKRVFVTKNNYCGRAARRKE